MEKLTFKLDQFEGPLDLLLYLISKHKLNIYDIEIASLLEQYLEIMEDAARRDLEVASEFLEMASRLVYLKTVSLLPKHEEEEETLRRELTGQLLEYQACKQVAALLAKREKNGLRFVREPMALEQDESYTLIHPKEDLLAAYLLAMGKAQKRLPPPAAAFSGIMNRHVVSVTSKIIFVLKCLYKQKLLRFGPLFEESGGRSEVVATFLAVLELVKSKRIVVSEDNSELTFRRVAPAGKPNRQMNAGQG